jgi:uncharacterized protein with FMN-binding domain
MKKIYVLLLCLGIFIILITISAIITINIANRQMNDLLQRQIQQINLDDLPNGKYIGEIKTIPVYVKVEVVIYNHRMTDIVILEHRSGQGEAANDIIHDILLNQSLDVDVISGATYSSQAIMIAIERALSGNQDD